MKNNLIVINGTESMVLKTIKEYGHYSDSESKAILYSISEIGCSSDVFNEFSVFPDSKSGSMSFMMTIKKYNINITNVAINALSFLLGLTPIGVVISALDTCKNSISSFQILTDREKAMIIFLREISINGKLEIKISNIIECFNNENNKCEINNRENLLKLLDSLADKNLIIIRTESIKVVK